jgi:hypothetical protein
MFTSQLREATENAIALAQLAAQGKMPPPIEHAKKCQACSLMGICLPFEVKHCFQSDLTQQCLKDIPVPVLSLTPVRLSMTVVVGGTTNC